MQIKIWFQVLILSGIYRTCKIAPLRRFVLSEHTSIYNVITSAKEVMFSSDLVCLFVRITQKLLKRFSQKNDGKVAHGHGETVRFWW